MSLKNFANRQLDDLFKTKPREEFVSPLGLGRIIRTPDAVKISVPLLNGGAKSVTFSTKLDALLNAKDRKDKLDKKAEERSQKDRERKEKRAIAEKERRKKRALAIKNIKETLAIPLEKRKEDARIKRENERVPSMFDGTKMTDANGRSVGPIFITGGFDSAKIDQMDQARPLSLLTAEYSEGVYGQSAALPNQDSDDNHKGNVDLDVNASFNQRVMYHVREEYFADIGVVSFPDSILYDSEDCEGTIELRAAICKLCAVSIPLDDPHSDGKYNPIHDNSFGFIDGHILGVHGHEGEPKHDERFGDIVGQMAKRLIREDRKKASEFKKTRLPLRQFLESQKAKIAKKETEAGREGFIKGPYVYDPVRRKYVQGWIRLQNRPQNRPRAKLLKVKDIAFVD